jgi:hypothetical protein
MNIPEYRSFINEALDKAEAEYGPIKVVSWDHQGKALHEYLPLLTDTTNAMPIRHGRYLPLYPHYVESGNKIEKIFIIGD